MSGSENPDWMGPLPAVAGCDCHVCRPEPSYDDLDRRTIDTVLEHGWQVMLVSDTAECSHEDHDEDDHHDHGEEKPAFAYTIGLGHRRGHPELLMTGLDHRLMHRALNHVAARVMNGLRLTPGDALEDVLGSVPLAVEEVSEDGLRETVTWSGWFHRRRPEAVALVWPDTAGVFAWQPGAEDWVEEGQPRRWRVPIEHRGGLAVDPEWLFPVPPEAKAFTCTHVVDDGEAVLFLARESDPVRGEDWSLHCGAEGHATDDMRVVHLAHLVRSAPSVRELSGLALDHMAFREDVDSPWTTTTIA